MLYIIPNLEGLWWNTIKYKKENIKVFHWVDRKGTAGQNIKVYCYFKL